MPRFIQLFLLLLMIYCDSIASAADRLVFEPSNGKALKHVVFVAGDEEYRTEETMPMLAKILSQKHGFKCTVLVNAAYFLTDREVPTSADVALIDPFYPSFYGFINEPSYWKNANLHPEDFGMGKTPNLPDPKGSPEWPFRDKPKQKTTFLFPQKSKGAKPNVGKSSSVASALHAIK